MNIRWKQSFGWVNEENGIPKKRNSFKQKLMKRRKVLHRFWGKSCKLETLKLNKPKENQKQREIDLGKWRISINNKIKKNALVWNEEYLPRLAWRKWGEDMKHWMN